MSSKVLWLMGVGGILLCGGCREEMPDGPRVPTSPVTGQILVDGKPAASLAITLVPKFERSAEVPSSSAFTDEEGRFQIGTFESGDGAPAGEYAVTLFWGQYNLLNGQYVGPDKLDGQYAEAEKPYQVIQVPENEPLDLGTIEVTKKKK